MSVAVSLTMRCTELDAGGPKKGAGGGRMRSSGSGFVESLQAGTIRSSFVTRVKRSSPKETQKKGRDGLSSKNQTAQEGNQKIDSCRKIPGTRIFEKAQRQIVASYIKLKVASEKWFEGLRLGVIVRGWVPRAGRKRDLLKMEDGQHAPDKSALSA